MEPAPGIFGNTVSRPLLQRRPEGVMQRVLREIEVTEETDQRRKDTARFGPIDRVYAVADPTGRAFGDAVPVYCRNFATHGESKPARLKAKSCSSKLAVMIRDNTSAHQNRNELNGSWHRPPVGRARLERREQRRKM